MRAIRVISPLSNGLTHYSLPLLNPDG